MQRLGDAATFRKNNMVSMLPVVSRANVHQLLGIVTLDDVLAL
jgi:Mg/Co/Ni transporter MgtE